MFRVTVFRSNFGFDFIIVVPIMRVRFIFFGKNASKIYLDFKGCLVYFFNEKI